jgi:hypothetical protein
MSAAILVQGKTAVRDRLKPNTGLPTTGLVKGLGVSDDSAAFAVAQVAINPTGAATNTHINDATNTDKTVTDTDDAFDATFTLDNSAGATYNNKVINTIALLKGPGCRAVAGTGTHSGTVGGSANAIGTDTLSRSLRGAGLGIGVQSGDIFTIGVRVQIQDNS